MTIDAALTALRETHAAAAEARVLVHRGTCGQAAGVERTLDELRGIAGTSLVEAACDGACWAAPAATVIRADASANGATHVHRFARLDESGVVPLEACLGGDCDGDGDERNGGVTERLGRTDRSLGDALAGGAYAAAAQALAMEPGAVVDAVEALGLTGRGGAHFPTALKWRFASGAAEAPLLVVNAEEGEPGVFKDRHMLEGDPHRLLEGVIIAAHATGAQQVFVYINGQARNAGAAFERALVEATEAGIVGGDALGAAVDLEVEIRSGAGGYVSGEETVILNSIEGQRPVPRFKPPQITEAGLFGRPTVLNNAETLAAATLLFDASPPSTKLVSLSGAVPRPGLYEVAVDGGSTWATVLAEAGAASHDIEALLLGGPSGLFVPPSLFDQPLEMAALGAGGVVALAAGSDVAAVALDLARYNASESCGECTPCREGTQRLVALLEAPALDRPRVDQLIDVMMEASLCQLGGMAGRPIASAIELFPLAFGVGSDAEAASS
ncbi:MAG TPA: NADH-ubiquinone oxidoreductase-F iron-sulfur binding region domain-containing protein [Dehalococcoidia bacterium]|nr:NADH-ubiquinone oxidoreductase-F iron-sulfur binding region domain-containing protein [Dehalococcoidia bacterium]